MGLTAAKVLSDALIANLILLEGQGYVLAIPDAYVQGRRFLSPGQISTVNYWQGYGAGFKGSLRVYPLIPCVFVFAAVYEATIGIYSFPSALRRQSVAWSLARPTTFGP